MVQIEMVESKPTCVNDGGYLLIDEVKTEPLDDNRPSDAFKINQRKRHLCNGCEKSYASYQSLWSHKKICNRNSNHTKRLDDNQTSDVPTINQRKWYVCDRCKKTLSNYQSLWRHKKICKGDYIKPRRLDDDQTSDVQSLKRSSNELVTEKSTKIKSRCSKSGIVN